MNNNIIKLSLLTLVMLASTELAFAGNAPQSEHVTSHKPVATILPEAGKLAGDDGVLHQGLALECAGGKTDGISYFSPTNDLDVAIGAPVNIEITVDHLKPVGVTAIRRLNEKSPDALTSKSDDADSAVQLIHNLEMTPKDVQVKVTNPAEGKTKTFRLKGSDMKKTVESFKAYCDV